MLARPSRSTLLCLLLAGAMLAAGCTAKDDGPASRSPDNHDGGDAAAPAPADPPAQAQPPNDADSGAVAKPAPRPAPTKVEDAGNIEGVFDESWDIDVTNVAFRSMTVDFKLLGVQDGAPPTARVHLALYDPEGELIKSALLGLGGTPEDVHWSFTNADIREPGVYTLKANTGDTATPVQATGFAKYELAALVEY